MLRWIACFLFVSLTPAFCADQWIVIHSPNFVVRTDAGEKRGREIALRFEQMRKVFETLIPGKVKTTSPLKIVAFRNSKELKQVSPMWKGKPVELSGFYMKGEDDNYIALDSSAENGWQVVFHEYGHFLLYTNMPPTPPWWDEGFADFYSTISVTKKDFQIGAPPEGYGLLLADGLMPLERLFSVSHEASDYNQTGHARNLFYAQSWLFVHYLYDKKLLTPTTQLFFMLRNNVPLATAVQKAYGKSFKELDNEMKNYLSGNKVQATTYMVALGLDSSGYTQEAMADLQVASAIAELHLHSADHQQQAEQEFRQILAKDPTNSDAHRALGMMAMRAGNMDAAIESFTRAADAGSQDARVQYFAAYSKYSKGPGAVEDMMKYLDRALQLNPNMGDAYNLKGIAFAQHGDYAAAVQVLEKAVELEPRRDDFRMNLASQYANAGKAERAEALLKELARSDNPSVASAATNQLQAIQQWKQQKESASSYAAPGQSLRLEYVGSEDSEKPAAAPANVDSRPIKFAKGTLLKSDCSPDGEVMMQVKVGAKTMLLHSGNAKKVIAIGADRFDCSWSERSVSINYREPLSDGVAAELFSIEVQ
jgi:tetratricopeptide (TPR) repeat protein